MYILIWTILTLKLKVSDVYVPSLSCDQTAVPGSRPGGQEEGWAGEDQDPEEEVQTENPGGHSETETQTAEKETYEEENKKGKSSKGVKTAFTRVYTTTFITVQ